MMKWLKSLALLTALTMLAGCGSTNASSSQEAGGTAAEPYVPTYTYKNPDPDMVLIKVAPSDSGTSSIGGDVTYENYRLYLDLTQDIAGYSAKQSMGLAYAIEQDLKKSFDITMDEEAFQQMAMQELMMAQYFSPAMFANLPQVMEATGMSEEQVQNALISSFRPQFVIDTLGQYFQQEAEKTLPPIDQALLDSGEDSEALLAAQQERDQKAYEAASMQMQEYSISYDDRFSLDTTDPEVLAIFDGEPIAYTDEAREYVLYSAASARVEAASFIHEGEMMLRDYETLGLTPDRAEFDATFASYKTSLLEQEEFFQKLSEFCADYGATTDDYMLALERPLWLQYAADLYYNALLEQYNALVADSGDVPATFEEYFMARFDQALLGSELVNISGKPVA